MRSVRSGFVVAALTAVGCCVVAACSADGGSDVDNGTDNDAADAGAATSATDAASPVDATMAPTNHVDGGVVTVDAGGGLPPADSGGGSYDASDAQIIEAGADAGPTGSPCPTKDLVQSATCGICGFETRVCEPDPNAEAGAPNVWQPWGFCQGQVAGGCVAGSMNSAPCGNCGTQLQICQNDCTYAVGACKGEPANACTPGSTDFEVGLSCDAGGRARTCDNTCAFGSFSACYVPEGGPPGSSLNIASTAGGKTTGTFTFVATQTIASLDADTTCPLPAIGTTVTAYQYIQLFNPTVQTATVSVWSSKATTAGAKSIDTIMGAYTGSTPPVTDAQREACTYGMVDSCEDMSDPTSCLSSWAGLMVGDGNQITIGPFASVFVYTAAFHAATVGDFQMTVRTETIQ